MEVRRGLVYPCQTMLDDVQIDASSYDVVKVDMAVIAEHWTNQSSTRHPYGDKIMIPAPRLRL
jgi:hypothetical protein